VRPLLLSFSGIRSYPGKIGPLDFTSKTLIAILGDTGAGKSTILEAITLALYGNCTWTDREHKALMAEGASQMTVDFTFAHDGQRWRVARIFHANTTPSSHLLQNLDTDEHIDNKRAVNKKITALLQLDFDSFITAVLLPQGKFDRLLNATGRERTSLLKGIFGVQAIEAMRDRASSHRDQLAELIHQAELARHDLLDNPAGTAQAAGTDADQAEQMAGSIRQALEILRSLREHARSARDQHAKLTAAGAALDQRETKDVDVELACITRSAGELAGLEAKTARAKQDFEKLRDDAEAQLTAAAQEGLTPQSLASAATLLDGMPDRLEELATGNAQLDKDATDIAGQARQLGTDKIRLSELQDLAGALEQARVTANLVLQGYREACDLLQDSIRTALRQAGNAGKAQRDEEGAYQRLRGLQEAVLPLKSAADMAAAQLQSADEQLTVVHSHDAAHTAGMGLAAGDLCLICSRPLPQDYQPPAPAAPDTLLAADQTVAKAKTAAREAESALARAQADTDNTQREYQDRQSATREAYARLELARQNVAKVMRELSEHPLSDRIIPLDEDNFGTMLQAACTRLSESGDDDQDKLLSASIRQLLSPAHTVEKALADAAAGAHDAATEGKADAARAAGMFLLAEKAHDDASARLAVARKRHATAQTRLARDLMALPALVRDVIPAGAPAITTGDIDAAQQIIAERRGQLDARSQDGRRATRELEKLATTRQELDQRRNREIIGPLHALATSLERWQDAIEQAVSMLPQVQAHNRIPARPAAITVEAVSVYAAALSKAESEARDRLAHAESTAGDEASTRLTELDTAAAGLRSGRQGSLAIALAEGEQLLDLAALDPVVAAETSARYAAERHRADEATARSQIPQAASLDTAIRAGRARLSAVDALRGLLGDAKFHQYLTDRRTHALLGVASEIFGQLSGGEFGFAPEFLIISRRSGAARDPKTLSGGETFLASLALALALVELHSRSGARLGALFLDEGFGSLDIDSLASSLAVLQAETGGDKLVAVISHLHAVAEAVQDVMWVERQPDGSSIRWLTPAERDALARQEVTSGLLNLI
jgi:exonuclease SbcC